VDAVRQGGARVFIQLTHAGREADPKVIGRTPVAPSAVAGENFETPPEALGVEEIERIIGDFVQAAVRAKGAGFDGVELCADRGDLVQQFLGEMSNRRTDDWGGNLAGRSRFLREIMRRITEALGSDYPVVVRLPSRNELMGGIVLAELRELARMMESLGTWAVEVGQTVDFPLSMTRLVAPDGRVARGSPARDIKQVISIPVIDEGNVRDLAEAVEIIRRGQADLVALGRPLVADPELVAKATTPPGEQLPCIYNNVCRGGRSMPLMRCPSNPSVGREMAYARARRIATQRKITVVGGGLAGLHASCLAARLGFQVTLHVAGGLLGGLLSLRARIPAQSDNYRIVDYLSRMLVRLNVRLRVRSTPTPERLLSEAPHAVFVTRRGAPLRPDIAGLDNVRAMDPAEVLAGEVQVGQKVCVIGGGLLAAETAYFLAHRAKEVILLVLPGTCEGWDRKLRDRNLRAFREMEGKVIDKPTQMEINGYGEISVQSGGRTTKVLTDTIVLAHGYEKADDRYRSLADSMERFYPIGDAYEAMALTDMVYLGTQAVLDLAAEDAG
jgi:2,4-dienoyl-CoA reductase-like NADH-dependent reductase (Old Yellow Enzyme family)